MQTVRSNDGSLIAYDKTGQGPALILIGGATIYRKFPDVVKLAEALSATFTVYNYDRRGRGDSTDTLPYSIDRELEDIAALVQAAGGTAYLYGVSSGGALALMAAASNKSVTKLAIYEPPFVAVDPGSPQIPPGFLEHVNGLLEQGRRGAVIKAFMKMVGVPGVIRWIIPLMPGWTMAKTVAHTLPYDLTILGESKLPLPILKKIEIPTLVLNGEFTAPSLRKASAATAKEIANSTYIVLPKQRHRVSNEILVPVLTEFFTR